MPKGPLQYKLALLKHGLEQLDIYRYPDRDEVRIRARDTGEVFMVSLPRHRELMSIEEYVEYVRKAIAKTKEAKARTKEKEKEAKTKEGKSKEKEST